MQARQAKHAAGADLEFKRGGPTDKAGRNFDEGRSCDREINKLRQTPREHFVGQDADVLGVVLKLHNVAGIVRTTQKVGLRGAAHAPDHLEGEDWSVGLVTTQA
jgi:hypothetical protein